MQSEILIINRGSAKKENPLLSQLEEIKKMNLVLENGNQIAIVKSTWKCELCHFVCVN